MSRKFVTHARRMREGPKFQPMRCPDMFRNPITPQTRRLAVDSSLAWIADGLYPIEVKLHRNGYEPIKRVIFVSFHFF